jgi:GntR family transcriptional regulator, rspAB operon transcriptional repressor
MIDTRRLEDKGYEYLLNEIIKGNIRYGQAIDIKGIAAKLHISVTPVLAAIKRLQFEQIVDLKPRSTYQVKVPTKKRIEEIYDLRELLESYAVSISFGKIKPDKLALLKSLVNQMERITRNGSSDSKKKIIDLDRIFHTELCQLACNESLSGIYRLLSIQMNMAFIHEKVFVQDRYYESHARIVNNLEHGKKEAIQALHRHFKEVRQQLSKVIENDVT